MRSRLSQRLKVVLISLFFLLLSGNLLACSVYAAEKQTNLTITDYETNIEVFANKSLQIEERMQIHFNEARHGPGFGLAWSYQDQALIPSMVRGKGDWFFHFRNFDKFQDEYRFGNPLKNHPAGTNKEYTLSYRYQWPADDDPKEDELYWNIINDQRPYLHEAVKFKVTLPKKFKASQVYITCGRLGSTDQSRVDWRVKGNSIVGKLLGPLEPNEAITLRVHLPEGYFNKARPISPAERYLRFILVSEQAIPLLTLPLGYLIWRFWGRKRAIVPVVEFYPPTGVNCAEAAWIYFGNSYFSDFSSLIVSWAARGFLTIEEKANKELCLHRLVVEPVPAPAYEQMLFKNMFDLGDESQVSVSQLAYKFYQPIEAAHKDMLLNCQANSPIYQKINKRVDKAIGRLIFLAGLVPLYYFIRACFFGDLEWAAVATILLITLESLFWFLVWTGRCSPPKKEEHRGRSMAVASGGDPLGGRPEGHLYLTALFMLAIGFGFSREFGAEVAFLSWSFSVFVLMKFPRRCGRQTEQGRSLQGQLAGFREFIRTAELDRIKLLVNENPSYFFDVLPYAATLGVADDWINKFRTLKVYQPQWYSSESSRDYNTDDFAVGTLMTRTLQSFNTQATVAPRATWGESSRGSGSSSGSSTASHYDSSSSSSSSSSSGSAGGGGGGSSMSDW